MEIPSGDALSARLEQVLSTIYLLFNEGYHATSHDDLIREDLIEEALRLCQLLCDQPITDRPETHALLALMIYHAARSTSRIDGDGAIVLLRDQDRSKWDHQLIGLANDHLLRASTGDAIASYHIEASIASLHANAASYESTNWQGILAMYDTLLRIKPTPIVALNRAIVVAEVAGIDEALNALRSIEGLKDHFLLHATMGDLLLRSGRWDEARVELLRANELTRSSAERALLKMKLDACME